MAGDIVIEEVSYKRVELHGAGKKLVAEVADGAPGRVHLKVEDGEFRAVGDDAAFELGALQRFVDECDEQFGEHAE